MTKPTRTRNAWAISLCAGLAATMLAVVPSGHAADERPGVTTPDADSVTSPRQLVAERKADKKKKARYTPPPGIKLNHPLRPKMRRNINAHVLKTINSTPRGSEIRMISWNVRSQPYRRALLKAHNRGVSVRVLMSHGVASRQAPNQDYGILKRGLKKGNAKRAGSMKSWMRTCKAACRGPNGIAHAKWFIFSKAGRAKWVTMAGSANLTEVATGNQWNDVFTVTGNKGLYDKFESVFAEAARDRTAHPAFQEYKASKDVKAWFLPYRGREGQGRPDPEGAGAGRLHRRPGCRHQRQDRHPDRADRDPGQARTGDRAAAEVAPQRRLQHQDRLHRAGPGHPPDPARATAGAGESRCARSPRTSTTTARSTATCT